MSGSICCDAKKAVDSIYKQCERQKALEWFAEAKNDDRRLFAMIKYYEALEPQGRQKNIKFGVARYKETSKTEQAVETIDRGRLMWERQAVEFWQSTDGGKLSEEDSQLKWDDLAATCIKRKIPWDMDSPNPRKPLRIRVEMHKDVDFRSSHIQSKEVEEEASVVKKPTEETMTELKNKLYKDFDKMSTGAADVGAREIATAMVQAGAGESFNGQDLKMCDLTALRAEVDEPPTAPKSDVADKPAAATIQAAPEWFDRDGQINNARRSLRGQAKVLHTSRVNACSGLELSLSDLNKQDPKVIADAFGEKAVAETRLTALRLIAGTDEKALLTWLTSFDDIGQAGPADTAHATSAASLSTATCSALGQAPPC
jgi:hypothetical protein